jgi:anti-anti-sigma factor
MLLPPVDAPSDPPSDPAEASGAILVDTAHLEVRGDLDYQATGELRERIDRAFDLARSHVVLDCAKVRFTDTGGLRLLLEATRIGDARGVRFVIANPSRSLRHLLRLAGVTEFLHVDDFGPPTEVRRAVVQSRGAAIHSFPVAHAL